MIPLIKIKSYQEMMKRAKVLIFLKILSKIKVEEAKDKKEIKGNKAVLKQKI